MEFIEMKTATATEVAEKERNLDSIEDTKPGPFVWLCATATAIGGSLFGCEYIFLTQALRSWLTTIQTTLVSSLASSSSSAMTSTGDLFRTTKKRLSLHYALPEHLSARSSLV